jgi:hypothetical protein
MHRNFARAYDCLQDEHDRIRAACVRILAQNDRDLERSIVHGTTTKCFYARSVYLALSSVASSI